ncbi:MAG TPA: GTPase [Planctomycetota bacterium]|nr:GTPase [Planctomycetota bacterium]
MTRAADTIVALSSAAPGGCVGVAMLDRAILRLSGARAIDLAQSVFTPTFEKDPLSSIKGWRNVVGKIVWTPESGTAHSIPCSAYVMRSPRSYTREDVVELHFPGLRWHVSQLIQSLLKHGARLAQPGEFTRRAYENGRLNLAQAQNVSALIQATTADEARAFAARLQQRAPKQQQTLRAEIEGLLAQVELGLDFASEDVEVISLIEMQRRLDGLVESARELAKDGREAEPKTQSVELFTRLPRMVLAGPTNAGKSTLFNALLGRDAALVSAKRHTTRDRVEALLHLNQDGKAVAALLIDTAGAGADAALTPRPRLPQGERASDKDWLRHAGWQMSLAALRSADVLLVSVDASVPLDEADWTELNAALAQASPAATILVKTKADLPRHSRTSTPPIPLSVTHELELSAHTGAGIEELRAELHRITTEITSRTQAAAAAAEAAAKLSAQRALDALERAAEALRLQHGEDVVAVELREALHACWQAEGILIRHDAVTEGMLDRIFAEFCIGK